VRTRGPDRRRVDRAAVTWSVTVGWPKNVPVTETEIDVFNAWFGDLFDVWKGHGCNSSGGALTSGLDGTASGERSFHPESAPSGQRLLRFAWLVTGLTKRRSFGGGFSRPHRKPNERA